MNHTHLRKTIYGIFSLSIISLLTPGTAASTELATEEEDSLIEQSEPKEEKKESFLQRNKSILKKAAIVASTLLAISLGGGIIFFAKKTKIKRKKNLKNAPKKKFETAQGAEKPENKPKVPKNILNKPNEKVGAVRNNAPPLISAANLSLSKPEEALQKLINEGENVKNVKEVDAFGNTVLHIAIKAIDNPSAQAIIDELNPEEVLELIAIKNEKGETPFLLANTTIGFDKIYKSLKKLLDDKTKKELFTIAEEGSIEKLESLSEELKKFEVKIDPNPIDDKGTLLLHKAIEKRHFQIAQWLVNHGADVTKKVKDSEDTALHLVLKREKDKNSEPLAMAIINALNDKQLKELIASSKNLLPLAKGDKKEPAFPKVYNELLRRLPKESKPNNSTGWSSFLPWQN